MADVVVRPPGGVGVGKTAQALIDTGAPVSAVALELRRDLGDLVEPVAFADGVETRADSLGRYTLGRLRVVVVGRTDEGTVVPLPAVTLLAQLYTKPAKLLKYYPLILGLHESVLEGRSLVRHPVPTRPGPVPDSDLDNCGEWYGQRWYLEAA